MFLCVFGCCFFVKFYVSSSKLDKVEYNVLISFDRAKSHLTFAGSDHIIRNCPFLLIFDTFLGAERISKVIGQKTMTMATKFTRHCLKIHLHN